MADISRIVDEVRGFLLSYDQSLTEELTELARAYASACSESNKRLARCQRLLQQGLRTEAIHLAKEPPDLLDSIQALDFADRPAWLEVVRLYDLAIPPEFDLTAIEFLHAAYLEDKPLRDLLRLHRRLALQRAPLPKRLQVLRELAEKDPNSPTWALDVQVFEAARVDQIKLEAAEAKRVQDVATLGALNDELAAKTWSSPPPKLLVRDVVQTLSHLRSVHRRQDQVELIAQLHDAFAALDVDKARELRRRWRLMDGEGRKGANPLENQVEPVFLWLDERDREDEEENRYHQALGDLERSLEEAARRDDLEDSREVLLGTGRGVPEELERKYRERIEEFSRQSARKLRLIGAAAALILAACLVVALLAWRQQAERENTAKVAAMLVEMIDSGRLIEARKLVDAESIRRQSLQAEPIVVEALSRLKSKEDDAARQAEAFETLYARASDEPPSATEPEALIDARKVAANADQHRRLDELWERRKKEYREETERIEAEARPMLDDLEARVGRLQALLRTNGPRDALSDQLLEASQIFKTLKDRADRFGEDRRRRYDQIAVAFDKFRVDLGLRDIVKRSEEEVTRAMVNLPDDPEGFARALTDAIAKAPDSPRSQGFGRVLAEKPAWDAALALAAFARGSKLDPVGPGRSTYARKRAADCDKLLAKAPSMPDRKLFEDLRNYYGAISLRVQGEPSLKDEIQAFFEKDAIGKVNVIVLNVNSIPKRFYTKESLEAGKGSIPVMLGYEKSSARPKSIDFDGPRPATQLSPQSSLVEDFGKTLEKEGDLDNWDAIMLKFMEDVGRQAEIDEILKFKMIDQLMGIAIKGSWPLKLGMEPMEKFLNAAGLRDKLLWMDPNNEAANKVRDKALEFARQLGPKLAEARERTAKAHQDLVDRYAAIPQPIGWLIKDEASIFKAITRPALPPSGELCIVFGTTSPAWEVVGTVKDRRASLSPEKFSKKYDEGTLVFVRERVGPGAALNAP